MIKYGFEAILIQPDDEPGGGIVITIDFGQDRYALDIVDTLAEALMRAAELVDQGPAEPEPNPEDLPS